MGIEMDPIVAYVAFVLIQTVGSLFIKKLSPDWSGK